MIKQTLMFTSPVSLSLKDQQIVITFTVRISAVNNTGYPPVCNCKKQVVSESFASQMP